MGYFRRKSSKKLTFMTKTNLEIEEEFNKYFLDCIRRRFGVARFEGDSELLRDDISNFLISLLQQRMDEIAREVEDLEYSYDDIAVVNKESVLNIIKSVDKNKNI